MFTLTKLNEMKKQIRIGDKVKWHDAAIYEFTEEDKSFQASRIYEVISITGDIITIADDYGEAEVYACEIELI